MDVAIKFNSIVSVLKQQQQQLYLTVIRNGTPTQTKAAATQSLNMALIWYISYKIIYEYNSIRFL